MPAPCRFLASAAPTFAITRLASKKKKKARLASLPPKPRPVDEGESRAAVALTVGWMLTLMSTTVALAMALVIGIALLAFPVPAGAPQPLGFLPGLLLFVAAGTGLLCLILTPLIHRVRRAPPPRVITIAAALIGTAPWVTIVVLSLRG